MMHAGRRTYIFTYLESGVSAIKIDLTYYILTHVSLGWSHTIFLDVIHVNKSTSEDGYNLSGASWHFGNQTTIHAVDAIPHFLIAAPPLALLCRLAFDRLASHETHRTSHS